jgi:outer membrane protein assembly factor BamB
MLLLTGGMLWPAQAAQAQRRRPDAGMIPLVNADEELGNFLNKAKEFIEKQDYSQAIDILQALLGRSDQCFVPTDDPHRFVSLASRVVEVIGDMPPDGLALYRRLYDAQAAQLLKNAAVSMDLQALRELTGRYFYTSSGPAAMNLLAGVLFDRGQFAQAGRCWRELYDHGGEAYAAGGVLARVAVCFHFAGEDDQARKVLDLLTQKHSGEEAMLGGRRQNALEFAKAMLQEPAPHLGRPLGPPVGGWLSQAGSPDSAAVMTPCYPVLSARWTTPEEKPESNPNIKILAGRYEFFVNDRESGNRPVGPKFVIKEGQLTAVPPQGAQARMPNGQPISKPLTVPPMIHPLIVGGAVLYRGGEGIIAHDLLTGEKIWDTTNRFPLYRQDRMPPNPGYPYGGYQVLPDDEGLQTLTAGDGRVYGVGNFLPLASARYIMATGSGERTPAQTSVLAAFSLQRQGALDWSSNVGEDRPDIMKSGKFLCAPTFQAGRLYTLVEFSQSFYLLCLSAENGQLIWKSVVGQSPVLNSGYYGNMSPAMRGSPPAVGEGKVVVTTNAGIVAAFEAESGLACWAYQYDSGMARSGEYYQPAQLQPPNPVIIAGGRVIALPSDSPKLIALKLEGGQREWELPRDGQNYLSYIDEQRVLLSSPSLRVVNMAGNTVWSGTTNDLTGRPAVTLDSIMASGKGQLVVVSLRDNYALTTTGLGDSQSLLGNLVCYDGKLVSANAAGVSAYFTYEEARAQLSQRLGGLSGLAAANLLYQRGINALNARRAEEGLQDMLQARKLAQEGEDERLAARAAQALYRIYVSMADRAGDAPAALENYNKAMDCAYSDRSRGEMLVRLAKYYGKIDQPAKAAELAQKITVDCPKVELEDVEIGPSANPLVRGNEDTPLLSGYLLGHRLIAQLIQRHGQGCYGAFDAAAKAELDKALAAADPKAMIAVADTYRHSIHGPAALLRAGENYYKTALDQPKEKRLETFGQACQVLGRLQGDYSGNELIFSGKLGMAMIWKEVRPGLLDMQLRTLRQESPDLQVSFAGKGGKLGDLLREFDGSLAMAPTPTTLPALTQMPKEKIFESAKGELILRDQDGQPLLYDNCLFLLAGNVLTMLDASAGSFQDAVRWENTLPVDVRRLQRTNYTGWHTTLAAALSKEGAIVVASRAGFAAVSIKTGKLLWKKLPDEMLVSGYQSVTVANNLLIVTGNNNGGITALKLHTGETAFTYNPPRGQSGQNILLASDTVLVVNRPDNNGRDGYFAAFDLRTGKYLDSITVPLVPAQPGSGVASGGGPVLPGPISPMGMDGSSGATLTPSGLVGQEGLLAILTRNNLKLVDPMLSLKQDIWSVNLAPSPNPAQLLAAGQAMLLVQPNYAALKVEARNLADYGRVECVLEVPGFSGRTGYIAAADIIGDKVAIITSTQPNPSGVTYFNEPLRLMQPALHVFALKTGKLLWSADLSLPGSQPYSYVSHPVAGQKHLTVAVKDQSYNRPGQAFVFDLEGGKLAEKFPLAGEPNPVGNQLMHRNTMTGSPAIAGGRLVLETGKGVEVFGEKDKN